MTAKLPVVLCFWLVASLAWTGVSATEECELGDDGTCISPNCVDTHEKCELWAGMDECLANPKYMLYNCRKSCKTCDVSNAELLPMIEWNLKLHEVGGDETLLETQNGMAQNVEGEIAESLRKVVENTTEYMNNIVFKDPKYKDVKGNCRERHPDCSLWKYKGECEKNPGYMEKHCAPTCHSCHILDFKHRCPLNGSAPEALGPGDLNRMFERLVSDEFYKQYEPTILSMPSPKEEGILDGPWVVTLDKLLTEEECDTLIDLGAEAGYKQSADVGKKNFDGTYGSNVNGGRTSTNAWCNEGCANSTVGMSVTAKIENVTGVPYQNSEYLQLLRYEVGQFYNTHHDYIPHHVDRQMGVRTLTVFLYLNDVEAGGGTEFPGLGITVMPKKGRALIWPSVLDFEPNRKDERTEHGALPVEKGIKYGANAWLHQKDFKEALSRGCI